MVIYIVLLLVNLLVGFVTTKIKNGKKVYFWFTVIQLTLIAGLRGNTVGTDTKAYINMFDRISQINTLQGLWDFREEFGYVLLNKTIFLLGGGSVALFTICGFITAYGLMKYLYDNTSNIYLATYFLICFMFFFTSMNIVRHYMGIAIGINSLTYLKKDKYLPSLLLLIISFFFHKLAAVMFVFPILNFAKKEKWFDIVFVVICLISVVYCKEILSFFASLINYDNYIKNAEPTKALYYIVMFLSVFGFVIFTNCMRGKVIKENKLEFYCLCIAISLTFIARLFFQYANRVAFAFTTQFIVLICKCLDSYNEKDKIVMKSIILPVMFIFFIYALYVMRWQDVTPYKFFWQ